MDGTAGNITALERELITLVRKSVEQPMRLIPSDLDPVRDFVGDDALDYTLIIGGFHCVNRIADLLDVPQEVLPGPLPRYEFLRRIMVRLAGILMSRMDLNNRDYGVTYATALEKLQPFFDNENGYNLERKLAPLKPRPKLVEAFLLLLEERRTRSSLDQTVLVKIHQMVERALPENIDETEGFHPIPKDPIEAFAFMGTRYAYRSTTDMIDALRQEGYDDLGILDLSIAIADANMWARFYRLLDLEAGLFYLT